MRDSKITQASSRPQRNSSIELLRLISAWFVVAGHFVVHNADGVAGFSDPITRAIYTVCIFPSGRTAVGIFVVITVWFLAGKPSFTARSILRRLWAVESPVLFYSITLGILLSLVIPVQEFTLRFAIQMFLPTTTGKQWWFITAYTYLILILPLLFAGFKGIGKRGHTYAVGITLFVFGIWRYLPIVAFPANGHLPDFIALATVVSYVRWYVDTKKAPALALIAAALLCLVCVGLCYYLPRRLPAGFVSEFLTNLYNGYFASTACILSIGISIPVFLLFKRMPEFHCTWLNRAAKSAFGIYLISDYPAIRELLWSGPFAFSHLGYQGGLLLLAVVPTIVFTGCLLIDVVRHLLAIPTTALMRRACTAVRKASLHKT